MARLDPLSALGRGGRISALLPGYETRDEQLHMAKAVAGAIESRTHLMVEAGTGVGKSFAYLVPAILAATELGKRVVVSTRTINLQNQLIDKDIPFLRTAMPQEFQAVLVKGRSNFISLRRLDSALARAMSSSPRDRVPAAFGTGSLGPNDQGWKSCRSELPTSGIGVGGGTKR